MMNTPDILLLSILFTYNTKGSTAHACLMMVKKACASVPAIATIQSAVHFPIVKWPLILTIPLNSPTTAVKQP